MLAGQRGGKETAQLLVAKGASITLEDIKGTKHGNVVNDTTIIRPPRTRCALTIAAMEGANEIIKVLLTKGEFRFDSS